jgi:exonuclease SbcD
MAGCRRVGASIGCRRCSCPVSCVPTVNKAVVAATVGAADAAQAVGEHLALLLRGYAPIHRAARRQGVPTIGVSHGTVFGCVSEHGVPMAGFDHEFTTGALFGPRPRPSCSGTSTGIRHGSRKDRVGRQCIAYRRLHRALSLRRGGREGVPDVGGRCRPGALHLEPTPARRTVDIVFEGKPDLDALRAACAQQDIAGALCACAGPSPTKTATRSTARRSSANCWGAAETKLEGASCPWCARGRPGSRVLANLADKVRSVGAGDRGAGRSLARVPSGAVQPGAGCHRRACAAWAGSPECEAGVDAAVTVCRPPWLIWRLRCRFDLPACLLGTGLQNLFRAGD